MRLTSVLLFSVVLFVLSSCGPAGGVCSTATCAGCCDGSGQCVDGTSSSGCGAAGLTCNVCSASEACVDRRCATTPVDAGVQPADAGLPIVSPFETWTWVDFPSSACGNGAPTGVGVNRTERSTDVLIYLQGGGACWNQLTCGVIASAANVSSGYGAAQFAADGTVNAPPFARLDANNPFKDMSYVLVPYCTGDVHAGDAVQTYPAGQAGGNPITVHHKGAKNLEAFLVRLKDTFPDARRVFLAGSSAGAFGAQLNYERVAATWPAAEVHLYADCGQMLTPGGGLLATWLASWNFSLPPDCANCSTDFTKFPAYLHAKYPNRRFGLLAYTQDQTLRNFFGLDATRFQAATLALSASAYDASPNAEYFILPGQSHVMLGNLLTLAGPGPGAPSLLTWTRRFLDGDAAWASVKP